MKQLSDDVYKLHPLFRVSSSKHLLLTTKHWGVFLRKRSWTTTKLPSCFSAARDTSPQSTKQTLSHSMNNIINKAAHTAVRGLIRLTAGSSCCGFTRRTLKMIHALKDGLEMNS